MSPASDPPSETPPPPGALPARRPRAALSSGQQPDRPAAESAPAGGPDDGYAYGPGTVAWQPHGGAPAGGESPLPGNGAGGGSYHGPDDSWFTPRGRPDHEATEYPARGGYQGDGQEPGGYPQERPAGGFAGQQPGSFGGFPGQAPGAFGSPGQATGGQRSPLPPVFDRQAPPGQQAPPVPQRPSGPQRAPGRQTPPPAQPVPGLQTPPGQQTPPWMQPQPPQAPPSVAATTEQPQLPQEPPASPSGQGYPGQRDEYPAQPPFGPGYGPDQGQGPRTPGYPGGGFQPQGPFPPQGGSPDATRVDRFPATRRGGFPDAPQFAGAQPGGYPGAPQPGFFPGQPEPGQWGPQPTGGFHDPAQQGNPPGPWQGGYPNQPGGYPNQQPGGYPDYPQDPYQGYPQDPYQGYPQDGAYGPPARAGAPKSGGRKRGRRNRILIGGAVVVAIAAVAGVIEVPKLLGPSDPGCKAYTGTALTAYNQTINDLNAQPQAPQAKLDADMTTAISDLTSAANQAQGASPKAALNKLLAELTTVRGDVRQGAVPSGVVSQLNTAADAADNAC